MKKILALLLAAVMCLSLVACGGGNTPSTNTDNSIEQSEQSNTTQQESQTNSTNNNSKDDESERINEWEEILFNNVWYGTCHGVEGSGDTIELVFYEDGSYSARYGNSENTETKTWNFMRLYDTAGEYLENVIIQTVPDYDTEKSLYQANCFTLGITNDGEYLLRTSIDYICYPKDNIENP